MRNLILLSLFLPVAGMAQNVWERPDIANSSVSGQQEAVKQEKPNPDAKYLKGAVTEVDGRIEWTLDVDVPGKDAQLIYDQMLVCLNDLTKSNNQLEGSCVSLVNKQEHIIVASIKEWLVFKDPVLSLDRTKFFYTLKATCTDNHLSLTMMRLVYRYEEDRPHGLGTVKAEDIISDKNALNRKQTKLLPGLAKFRRKTVDRKDYLFEQIKTYILK